MPKPPVAKKEPRQFEIHGRKMRDDYFWLRNKESAEVISYLEEENAYADKMMAHTLDLQEQLFQEMKGRIKETDESVPIKIGEFYYYFRMEEGRDYKIHCRKKGTLEAPEKIILDENVLAEGREYMRIGQMKVSPDQRHLAYSVDFAGGETFETQIQDIASGKVIDIVKEIGKQLEWDSSSQAIFYSELDNVHRDFAVSRHVIGTDMSKDERIFEEKDTSYMVFLYKSRDGVYLFISSVFFASETTEVRFVDLAEPNHVARVFHSRTEGMELYLDHSEGYFYFVTNADDAINFKLMRTRVSALEKEHWEELIGHSPEVKLNLVFAFRNHIVVSKRQDGYAGYMIYSTKTGVAHDIQLPEEIYALHPAELSDFISEVQNQNPVYETDSFRFVLSSPVTPNSVYDYHMDSRQLELRKMDEIKGLNAANFVTERRYATAIDGTRIPISLAYRKDISLNGNSPALLHGYGAYGVSTDPQFSSERLSLIERGVIFAIAHVRGGGEFGKTWYRQGKLKKKMNTFTDFIACAEFLISKKFTSQEKLCIMGRSAGGLLMGAVANLRPDLFKSIIAPVPFVDVINTMLDDTIPLTIFEYREWGNPNIEEEFQWMMEYSPYDNVTEKDYPHILVTAGLNDSRVPYWEPAKWTAKLRVLKTDNNILLLKTQMSSGHGGKSGRYESLKEMAFYFAFLLDTMKIL